MATYKSPSCKGTTHLLFLKLSVLCSQVVTENSFQKSSYFPSLPALCKAITGLWVHATLDLHARRRESLFAPAAKKLVAAPPCKANSPFHFPPAIILLIGCHWRFHLFLSKGLLQVLNFWARSNFKRRAWLLTTASMSPQSASLMSWISQALNIQF